MGPRPFFSNGILNIGRGTPPQKRGVMMTGAILGICKWMLCRGRALGLQPLKTTLRSPTTQENFISKLQRETVQPPTKRKRDRSKLETCKPLSLLDTLSARCVLVVYNIVCNPLFSDGRALVAAESKWFANDGVSAGQSPRCRATACIEDTSSRGQRATV